MESSIIESSVNSTTEAVKEIMSKMPFYFLDGMFQGMIIIITNPYVYIPLTIYIVYKIAKVIYKKRKR